METIPWIMMAVATLIIIIGILAIFATKKLPHRPPDYYTFFWMGLVWILFGLPTLFSDDYSMSALFIMGIVFFALGLANKKKWKQNRIRWQDLTPVEKKWKMIIIIVLSVLVVVGLVLFLFLNNLRS